MHVLRPLIGLFCLVHTSNTHRVHGWILHLQSKHAMQAKVCKTKTDQKKNVRNVNYFKKMCQASELCKDLFTDNISKNMALLCYNSAS